VHQLPQRILLHLPLRVDPGGRDDARGRVLGGRAGRLAVGVVRRRCKSTTPRGDARGVEQRLEHARRVAEPGGVAHAGVARGKLHARGREVAVQ